ncbi:hypothetical protein AXG93_1617s1140 [Marchantia polymorpha subsp. ruderalis]|uniref:Uncharacterized protein n=1 Tax=Marchantia polymorpha subsp. ruderalis TaxID=1480154 RepID=A0A176W6H0_MARPO|nr:hypothetical protein AXG93_1617s1140 [Marchantia polymorpha subsp. ruderalis]
MEKNKTEGEDLRDNPMMWRIEHWAKVMGPCAGSDGDLLFEKSSVNLTRMEEFSCVPLFNTGRSGTNGWKTADYKDPKRWAIALGIIHILRTARTTYVTAWQVGFLERVMKGQRVHWARIFYDFVWTTARGPVQVEVLPNREKPDRRLANRRKMVTDDEEDLMLERTRSVGSEDVLHPKSGEEVATEFTLSEAILEQIVAEVGGTVGKVTEDLELPLLEEEVRSKVGTKTSAEEVKTLEITFTDFLQDSVVPLLKYLDTKR